MWVANLTGVMRLMPYIPAKHLAAGLANMGSVSWDTIEKSGYFWDRYERGSSRFSAVAVDGSDQVARDTMLSETRKGNQNLAFSMSARHTPTCDVPPMRRWQC